MNSKVTLYYKSLVTPEKNFVLDTIGGNKTIVQYLVGLTRIDINNYQYVKHQLSVSIKINASQADLQMIDSKDLNYVAIQNFDVVNNAEVLEKKYYYFVTNKIWRSKNTIELVLSMDTLNTFQFNVDYEVSKKSLVKRMHKDRFEKSGVFEQKIFEVNNVLSYATNGLEGWNYLFKYDPYDIGTDMDEESARLFREYGARFVVTRVYDNNDHRWLEPFEFDAQNAEITMTLEDETNEIYLTWNIPITTDANHSYYFDFDVIGKDDILIRKIDLKSEDISCPVYKTKEDLLQESNMIVDWALYYKNQTTQDTSPVDCYLTANQPLKFKTPGSSRLIDVNDIPSGNIILITPTYQGQLSFKVNDEVITIYQEHWEDGYDEGETYYCLGIMNFNGTLRVYKYIFGTQVGETLFEKVYESAPIDNAVVEFLGSQDGVYGYETTSVTDYHDSFPTPNFTFSFSSSTTITLFTKDTIDKTKSENLKIINIPYCPSEIEFNNDEITLPPLWTYDATYHFLRLTDLNARFKHKIVTPISNILEHFNISLNVNVNASRSIKDSKLFHSDYFRPKFVYDSFYKIFPLEQLDYTQSLINNESGKFEFTFVMTRNIVSKFLFKFDYVYKHSNEDFENIVAVARNNEEVLYNSSYLNYIRTGYNYDLKTKERQEQTSAIGLGLSIAGLVASIGLSFVPGGQAVGVAGIVGAGIGIAGQMVNYAKTISQNEENLQRKLEETQRQAVSVLNADDYDLLYEYSSNKAKLCLYEVSDNMKNVLDDLFYYCGYVVNEQMIPVVNSRYWFNFVQAGLIINESANLTIEIEDDIKEKFEQGVTFLHMHGVRTFDFSQEKENWENSLID